MHYVSRIHILVQLVKVLLNKILVPRSFDGGHILERILVVFICSDFVEGTPVEVLTCFYSLFEHSFILRLDSVNEIVIQVSFRGSPFIYDRGGVRRVD
jgi:hypothetical protein